MATLALNTTDPLLLFPAMDEPVTITNLDSTNSVYLGPEEGLYGEQAGLLTNPLVDTLPAGASIIYTGTSAKYGLAASGNPAVRLSLGVRNFFQT